MLASITSIFSSVVVNCLNWFNSIFEASGMLPLFFASIGAVFAVRYFISPIVGSGLGSDSVFLRSGKSDKSKGNGKGGN